MDPLEFVLLAVAAFIGGGINAVAGGGTLICFPALIAVGYSAKVANVTNTVALWPGSIGGSMAYLPEINRQRQTIKVIALPTIVGALLGSFLFLSTSNQVFDFIVPFLILAACALLFFQPRITAMAASGIRVDSGGYWPLRIGTFIASIYGGYFGAGLGIIVLAVFGFFLEEDIQHANALKGLVSFFVNGLASGYFIIFGNIAWEAAAIMAVAALVGGYLGANLARKLPRERLRIVAVTYGTIAALILLVT